MNKVIQCMTECFDELINHNKQLGELAGKVKHDGLYWFILTKDDDLAVNPEEFVKTDGDGGHDVYPCISFELSQKLYIWGLAVNKTTLNIEWVEQHEDPSGFVKDAINRIPFFYKENEIIGEKMFYQGKFHSLKGNPFIMVTEDDKDRINPLISAYELFKS